MISLLHCCGFSLKEEEPNNTSRQNNLDNHLTVKRFKRLIDVRGICLCFLSNEICQMFLGLVVPNFPITWRYRLKWFAYLLFAGGDDAGMDTRVEIKEINWNYENSFSFPYSLDYIIASGTNNNNNNNNTIGICFCRVHYHYVCIGDLFVVKLMISLYIAFIA